MLLIFDGRRWAARLALLYFSYSVVRVAVSNPSYQAKGKVSIGQEGMDGLV